MSKTQQVNEVNYKIALRLLDKMLRNGFITTEEYQKIDHLNRETFSPEFLKVYG